MRVKNPAAEAFGMTCKKWIRPSGWNAGQATLRIRTTRSLLSLVPR